MMSWSFSCGDCFDDEKMILLFFVAGSCDVLLLAMKSITPPCTLSKMPQNIEKRVHA